MRVSVIICTLDRADALNATLECLRHQNHDDFEVIVVNGPSTDHTLDVLEPWRDRIRYRENPDRNLSKSRNIGIRASVGELLAFIDDDALPEPEWLNQAIPAFDDPEVAGAGGIVFDHTGMDLQYRYTATDRLCRTARAERDFAAQCFPGTFQFPYLQGTNQIYRRGPLLAVGGFDENIFFYGDDCDICGRLIDAGWVIRQLPTSPVHHKYLPSGIRDHQRITTNWYPVVHDHTYFALRHASPYIPQEEILHSIHDFIHGRVADTQWHEAAGRLPAGFSTTAEATCLRGFAEGLRVGLESIDAPLPRLVPEPVAFLPFPSLRHERRRRIIFVSSSFTGNVTGGIGRLISDLAPAVAARGHDVRVITRALGAPAVDFEDGVWVHRVDAPLLPEDEGVAPDVLAPINAFATAAAQEVTRLRGWTEPDLVFAPLWDAEAIGVLRETDLPVAVHVSTPIAVIGPMAGYLRNDGDDDPRLRRLLELDVEVLGTADIFQANTVAVTETMRSSYGEACSQDRWDVVNIGLADRRPTSDHGDDSTAKTVFFAGRFEARKGIDTLLEAMARLLPERPDLRLVLAGEDRPLAPGEAPIGAAWRQRHAGEPWIGRVSMPGVVDDDTLHQLYARADVVVLPSRYESFGLVMVEALMHGRPLVSTNASGVREVVRNGVDGLLVEPGDVDQLEQAIRRLLDDPSSASLLGKSGRQRFEERFAIDRVAERFEAFFDRLSTRGAGAGRQHARRVLNPGGAWTIDLHDRVAATAIVRAVDATSLRIVDREDRAFSLAAGERRRIRLDVGHGGATILVGAGSAIVERVVVVDEGPSAI
jgi:glycogen synthase